MTSISDSSLSVAICDQYAFYPFRALVSGGVESWETLDRAEQFVRTVLLHDYLEMDGEPMPSPDEEPDRTDDQIEAGGRNVITAFLPILDGYEGIIHAQLGPARELSVELSPRLLALAAAAANSEDATNAYYKSHVRYLQNLSLFVRRGGSLWTQGAVGRAAALTAQELPAALLQNLDLDLKRFAAQANRGELGLIVPPFLSALLSRAAATAWSKRW